jgi:hypothetical protein
MKGICRWICRGLVCGGVVFSRVGYYMEGMRFASSYHSVKVKGDGEVGKREVLIS